MNTLDKKLNIRFKPPLVKYTNVLASKKRKRYPNRPLTKVQNRTLLSSIDTDCDDALIRLGFSVGLRVSEVAGCAN